MLNHSSSSIFYLFIVVTQNSSKQYLCNALCDCSPRGPPTSCDRQARRPGTQAIAICQDTNMVHTAGTVAPKRQKRLQCLRSFWLSSSCRVSQRSTTRSVQKEPKSGGRRSSLLAALKVAKSPENQIAGDLVSFVREPLAELL
ncbi:hypothetical protein BDP55DRAFT_49087 [Colletotrichum godetiae]|uniref:Uncharacterized protein n=1 Tax=Colletotrichum godetiae TaxID=1209918 RepID=A0AAJ0ART7_9PEZI|nr:uncharacterized protein BDP55DRAFT_49087 [Colletotrichum godetiae]KAK1688583.1 hypothetical protein BDP55DRAFT_49087 [Colletotrichum godetiae]